jgi:hypothetical protein
MTTKAVGFDQKVLLHHLDYTANEARKLSRKEMYEILDNFLREDIKGAKSRKNAITMLMKIWFIVDDENISLRNRALELFPELNKDERLLLHWGMVILAYPFFKDLILKMGNLYRLQEEVPSVVIGKKMKELYGDRRRVEVATSAVLMSLKAWGVVELMRNRSYNLANKISITHPGLQTFLVEVIIKATNVSAIPLDLVQNHTLFFPFQYEVTATLLRQNNVFQIDRQGVDMLMVELSS